MNLTNNHQPISLERDVISLLICGIKENWVGLEELISVNTPPFNISDIRIDGFDDVDDFYFLRHYKDYILYALVSTNIICKADGRDKKGFLFYAISIPRTSCLSGGKNPYVLLKELTLMFIASNMMLDSVSGRYRINSTITSVELFKQILGKYSLVPYTKRYVVMTGHESRFILTGSETATELFFKDTQYSEFTQYRDIFVAEKSLKKDKILPVKIPRKHTFSIFINGNDSGLTVDNETQQCVIHTEDIKFTLAEVRAGMYCKLKIDEEQERICYTDIPIVPSVNTVKKPFGINIEFKPNKKIGFDCELNLCMRSKEGRVFHDYVILKKGRDRRSNMVIYSAFLPLSDYWKECYLSDIRFSSKNYEYASCPFLNKLNDGERIVVESCYKKTLYFDLYKILTSKILLVIVSFLLGMALYVVLDNFMRKELKMKQRVENDVIFDTGVVNRNIPEDSRVIDVVSVIVSPEVQIVCDEYFNTLKRADLAFSEVDVIAKWLEDHDNDVQKPVGYEKIAEMIPLFVEAVRIVRKVDRDEDLYSYIKAMANLNARTKDDSLKSFRDVIFFSHLTFNITFAKRERINKLFGHKLRDVDSFIELRMMNRKIYSEIRNDKL